MMRRFTIDLQKYMYLYKYLCIVSLHSWDELKSFVYSGFP